MLFVYFCYLIPLLNTNIVLAEIIVNNDTTLQNVINYVVDKYNQSYYVRFAENDCPFFAVLLSSLLLVHFY
jgi:hypothetical protein